MKKLCSLVIALVLLTTSVFSLGAAALTLPSLTQEGSYESSEGSKVYYYSGASSSSYTSYTGTLTSDGYTMVQDYYTDGNSHSLWTKGSEAVYVSYLAKAQKMRVFVGSSSTPYHTEKAAASSDICSAALWQLDVDNSYLKSGETDGASGGMSYVIRLTDGTFVIIDGGYQSANDSEAKNLYALLCANNVLSGKPVVSAWFITHLHNDHYGALKNMTNKLLNKIEVKGFYYNFNKESIGDTSEWNATQLEGFMKQWSGARLYSKLHTGMVMGFAGATVEVLATHEDVRQFGEFNGANDTSSVLRFNIAEQSILFLADAYTGVCAALMGTYTAEYLKSDIMQIAHHGFDDGGSEALYKAVQAKTLLWPMDITRYVNGTCTVGTTIDTKTFLDYYDNTKQKVAYDAATDVFVAYKTQMLSLPYTPVGNKPDNVEEAYTALAKSKVAVAEGMVDLKLQMKADGSAIRFIGVVGDIALADFDSLGFEISFQYGGKNYVKTLTTDKIFTSVVAGDDTYSAESFGGKYLYVVEVYGLENISEDVEFVITGTATHKGNTYSYAAGHHTVRDSVRVQNSGNVTAFTFADIISGTAGWTQK